jgi:hypothetical protein
MTAHFMLDFRGGHRQAAPSTISPGESKEVKHHLVIIEFDVCKFGQNPLYTVYVQYF